jgi:hypothetical protein
MGQNGTAKGEVGQGKGTCGTARGELGRSLAGVIHAPFMAEIMIIG